MSGIPEIESQYSPSYKRVILAGMFGGLYPGGLEAIVYSEERIADKALSTQPVSPNRMRLKRTIELELLIDPFEMKAVHGWIGQKIKEYEALFGRIVSPEELESRGKRDALDNE